MCRCDGPSTGAWTIPTSACALAQGFVAAKLAHQRTLLQRHNRELGARGDRLGHRAAGRGGQHGGAAHHRGLADRPRRRGHRGLLQRLPPAVRAEWKFERRARRPPPDPVNVLLSLGYTLLGNSARGAVQAAGLDPYAGFLHEYVYNRPSLALDLLEEFRPVVDGIVLWACRGGQVTPRTSPQARPTGRWCSRTRGCDAF
jgi:CRISPR-associated protein Cas1